jgi:hypothetical protein
MQSTIRHGPVLTTSVLSSSPAEYDNDEQLGCPASKTRWSGCSLRCWDVTRAPEEHTEQLVTQMRNAGQNHHRLSNTFNLPTIFCLLYSKCLMTSQVNHEISTRPIDIELAARDILQHLDPIDAKYDGQEHESVLS